MNTIQAQVTDRTPLVNASRNTNQSFTSIYENYGAAMHNTIFRIVKSQPVAEDVLQEAFIKIWKNYSYYDDSKGRLFTWLTTVAKNCALDYLRSKGHKQAMKRDHNPIKEDAIVGAMHVDHIGISEILNKELLPDNKIVMEMIYLQGYTLEATAKEMGIPLGTVKTKVRNSINTLRKVVTRQQVC